MAALTGGPGPGVAGLGDFAPRPLKHLLLHPFFVCRFLSDSRSLPHNPAIVHLITRFAG